MSATEAFSTYPSRRPTEFVLDGSSRTVFFVEMAPHGSLGDVTPAPPDFAHALRHGAGVIPEVPMSSSSLPLPIAVCAFLVALLSLLLNAFATSRGIRSSRVIGILDAVRAITSDPAMVEAFYLIEYDRLSYPEHFHDSSVERQIDRLLRHLSDLGGLFDAGLARPSDFAPFAYYFVRVFRNPAIQRYLAVTEQLAHAQGLRHAPYESFARLASALQ